MKRQKKTDQVAADEAEAVEVQEAIIEVVAEITVGTRMTVLELRAAEAQECPLQPRCTVLAQSSKKKTRFSTPRQPVQYSRRNKSRSRPILS